MTNIVVIGGGGHARVLLSILQKIPETNPLGYTALHDAGPLLGVPYLGTDEILAGLIGRIEHCAALIGLGNVHGGTVRARLREFVERLGYVLPAVVSPDAVVCKNVTIGSGTVIMDGAVVNVGTVVGECSVLNTNCTVDHDCVIGDYVHIAPGATLSGGVHVGNNTLVGVGATVIQSITISNNCLIGAGATVVSNLDEPGTYIGIPARRIS